MFVLIISLRIQHNHYDHLDSELTEVSICEGASCQSWWHLIQIHSAHLYILVSWICPASLIY